MLNLISKYVAVALVTGTLVLGCNKGGGRNASDQKRLNAKTAAPLASTLALGGGVTMELVLVPAGEFMMGSPASEARSNGDETQHRVRITKPFYMSKYEVTQVQYERIMGTNPSHFKGASNPVELVTWNDATGFCRKLSQKTDNEVRLPTEAEWEYACRAGTTTPFHYGSSLGSNQANFLGNYPYGGAAKGVNRRKTTNVGNFAANAWGLYDMHGNVWEWCSDWYDKDYCANSPRENPTGPPSESSRVLRGGSFNDRGNDCRSVSRFNLEPTNCLIIIGFRVVASPSPGH